LFLEELLRKRYIESVPLIIPLLEKEQRNATRKLREISQEISDLDEAKLKEKAQLFHDSFLAKVLVTHIIRPILHFLDDMIFDPRNTYLALDL